MLAGAKLLEGARSDADPQAGSVGESPKDPSCAGQAYFVADEQPCNPQTFMDGVFDGLGERLLEGLGWGMCVAFFVMEDNWMMLSIEPSGAVTASLVVKHVSCFTVRSLQFCT